MYQIAATGNPSCWLGPIWGVANYMTWRGLVDYGFSDEARELGEKTVKLFENDLNATGELHEYYDPESGTPIMNPGFQNWNLLSLNIISIFVSLCIEDFPSALSALSTLSTIFTGTASATGVSPDTATAPSYP